MYKTDYCGDLRASDEGREVTLAGWVHRRRDHGGLIFIDLRDSRGLVQVVFLPEDAAAHAAAEEARGEYVVQVRGTVQRRRAGTENANLETGEIEVRATSAAILNSAKTPPFYINDDSEPGEVARLKYRYLDLRRERMHGNIVLRAKVVKFIRDFLTEKGSSRSRPRCWQTRRRKGRETTSSRAACTRGTSTPCHSRRSSSSSC